MTKPTLYERITEAREILGLGEEATLAEIDLRVKTLLKRWHPDCCGEPDTTRCTEITRRILEATALIRDYCAHYRFSFRVEEVEKYLSPEEWWEKRFGNEPLWATGGHARANSEAKDRPTRGRRR